MMQDHAISGILKSFRTSLLISATLVVPFIGLELVNRWTYHEEFPFMLFTFMSLYSLFIVLLLSPVLRKLIAEKSVRALRLSHWVGLILGVLLIVIYTNVVIDQLPCFLGVQKCD